MDTTTYQNKVTEVWNEYKSEMGKILEELQQSLSDRCIPTDNYEDWTDDEYNLHMIVQDSIDITFYLLESLAREGTTEGISFAIWVDTYEGKGVGSLTPYNFSDSLWVDVFDDDAIEERFNIMKNADLEKLVDLIEAELVDYTYIVIFRHVDTMGNSHDIVTSTQVVAKSVPDALRVAQHQYGLQGIGREQLIHEATYGPFIMVANS